MVPAVVIPPQAFGSRAELYEMLRAASTPEKLACFRRWVSLQAATAGTLSSAFCTFHCESCATGHGAFRVPNDGACRCPQVPDYQPDDHEQACGIEPGHHTADFGAVETSLTQQYGWGQHHSAAFMYGGPAGSGYGGIDESLRRTYGTYGCGR